LREIDLPPSAPALLGSLRAIGYSFDSAVADIIDNSVAAQARAVDLEFRVVGEMYVAIVDDGIGMSSETLEQAMQHGGFGPDRDRDPADLGRFGLGLKTASLSQCRRLTVASLKDGVLSGAQWNLNRVEATGRWTLGVLEEDDLRQFPHLERLRASGHGTIVMWREFDRALGGEANPGDQLGTLVDASRGHLALVFHRYLKPDAGQRPLVIRINGLAIKGSDPFLSVLSTQLPPQSIKVEGHQIAFTPFILPHRSRMTKQQLLDVDGHDGLRRTQGFYVYRNRRLISSGTWFRLMRQDELTKLARVRIDMPNALDHLWQIDVKKSTATPPMQVRAGLTQVLDRIGVTSKRVITHRGWKARESVTRLWNRLETPTGVNYQVNRDHPSVATLLASKERTERAAVARLLVALEMTLPFQEIYVDVASEREVIPEFANDEVEEELRGMLAAILETAQAIGSVAKALQSIPVLEPFNRYPDTTKRLLREVQDA
jgi:Histidine kinase-, DNA gyrase B-, and HSP90-like ATPase